MTSSLTRQLTQLLKRPIEDTARHRASLHVLDWVGCAVAGSAEPAGRLLAERAQKLPIGSVTGLGTSPLASGEDAAFLNGGLGNIFEMDDVHRTAILHPGPVTVPAALAAAEAENASGHDLLDAVVRGYEAVIRLGTAVGPGHYAQWHNTSTCGPFGSAAAVASILSLDEDQTVWALGNAGTQSSGPWRCRHEKVMTKQLHTARAAQAGYAAASLASIGFTGPEFILEGEQGFFSAMCPDGRPNDILSAPDGPWKIWETSFKPWPACRHAHPAIDAALLLKERGLPAISKIASIEILTYEDAQLFCDRQNPETSLEAKFSLQHSVALCLTDGAPRLEGFDPEAIARPDLTELRQKCLVTVEGTINAAYPRHFGSGITLTLSSGETISAEVADALGDPENPLDEDRLIAKARMLMEVAGVSEDQSDAIVNACLGLAQGGSLQTFSQALQSLEPSQSEDLT